MTGLIGDPGFVCQRLGASYGTPCVLVGLKKVHILLAPSRLLNLLVSVQVPTLKVSVYR